MRTIHFSSILVLLASAGAAAAAEPRVEDVIVVFKTHFDIGYTDMARNVVQRYRTTMIDDALRVADRNRDLPRAQQFVWTLPGWPLAKIMEDWPGQTAERSQRLQRAFREGRFVVNALPFSTHTELLEPEDIVRSLGYASRLSRAAGLPLPRDAKMTDVACCQSWLLPTLLKHAGVEFLHLGCNGGVHPVEVPLLFWWEGPDGARLLTMYNHDYGSTLLPPADWPHKTWLALICSNDNHGPPTPEEVKSLLDRARVKLPGVRVRIGRMSDFADAILAEKPRLEVVRGDMPDSWIHGPMCNPDGASLARTTRPLIGAAESLQAELGAWGVPTTDAAPRIAYAYEQSLLYGEHTWGGSLSWITPYSGDIKFYYGDKWKACRARGDFQRIEESWDEHTAYIHAAHDAIMPVLDGGLKRLAEVVSVPGERVVVYNPLPWPRGGLVRLSDTGMAVRALKPTDGGPAVPVVQDGKDLVFAAADVPPLGYRTYLPAEAPAPAVARLTRTGSETIESPFFKVAIDPHSGAVRSLVEKHSGRELVDAHAAPGLGQYLYERFGADNVKDYFNAYATQRADWAVAELGKPNLPPAAEAPYRAASPEIDGIAIEQNPLWLSVIACSKPTAKVPCGVTTKVIVYAGGPYVDIEITLHDKPADPWPEAGWLCLPFAVEKPRFRLGRQSSIIDPAADVIRGANRYIFGINSGLAIFDPQGRGVGLCPLDHPLVCLDRPGCWKYSLDFLPQKPVAYVNLFNNQYNTNFRLWNEGTWTSRVRIWAFDSYAPEAAIVTPSLEARWPLLAARTDRPAAGRTLPPMERGIALSRRGVLVTAFGKNPDGDGTVLRLWELAGQSGACTVALPRGMRPQRVLPVDLRGTPAGPAIPCSQGSFVTPLGAWAPASFVIEKQE